MPYPRATIIRSDVKSGILINVSSVTFWVDGSRHWSTIANDLALTRALTSSNDSVSYVSQVVMDYVELNQGKFRLIGAIRALFEEPNAGGGTAQYSEYLSAALYLGFGARNFMEEMAVPYCYLLPQKKVDYLCSLYGTRIGVSVKRAVNKEIMLQLKDSKVKNSRNITTATFTKEHAINFLHSAITGLVVARSSILDAYDFNKAVLHVWCPTERVAHRIRAAFEDLDLKNLDVEVGATYLVLHLTICYDKEVYLGK